MYSEVNHRYPDSSPQPAQAARLETARNFAIEAARLAANTRCHSVVVLDMRELSPVTDFFVIATGTSARQMRTVIDDLEELAEKLDYRAISRSGYESETWILIDFVDVIIHVFNDDSRRYYDLDNLWADAPRLEWNAQG